MLSVKLLIMICIINYFKIYILLKKCSKVPDNEILKAKQLRTKYFEDKDKQLKKKK